MSSNRVLSQARAHATREAILRAAAAAFERGGYDGTTIADILASNRDITKGALYFHFSSKEHLATAIIEEQGSWLTAARESDLHPVQEVVEVSHRFARALQEDVLVRASIKLTVEHGTFEIDDARAYSTWIDQVRQNYARAKRLGHLRDGVTPMDAAYLTTSTITGLQLVTQAVSQRKDLNRRLTASWRILLPALLTTEALPLVSAAPRARR